MRIHLLFALIFSFSLNAQPGPCFGIKIGGLYTKDLKPVERLNNPDIKVRQFVLDKNKVGFEIYSGLGHSRHINDDYLKKNDRRFLISYGSTTMMVDFVGFGPEYNCDYIDSLMIMPGYFIYHRDMSVGFWRNTMDPIGKLLYQGLTVWTYRILAPTKRIIHKDKIPFSFLDEKDLTASFLLTRAGKFIADSNYNAALADIGTAIKKNAGVKDCKIRWLLCDALLLKGDYQLALEELNPAFDCEDQILRTRQDFYLKRIEVFTGLKRYQDALRDYDTLMDSGKRRNLYYYSEKEMHLFMMCYRIKYIKDYDVIMAELKEDCSSGKYGFYTGRLCFELANLQFRLKNEKEAYKTWVTAFDKMSYGHRQYESYAFFDSLLQKHPNVPELYYLRAMTSHAIMQGPYFSTLKHIEDALADLDKAEKMGIKPDLADQMRNVLLDHKRVVIASEKWKKENGK